MERQARFGEHVCEILFGEWQCSARGRYMMMTILSAFHSLEANGDDYEPGDRVELCNAFRFLWHSHWWSVANLLALLLDAENLRQTDRASGLPPDVTLTDTQRSVFNYDDATFDATVEFSVWFCIVYDTRCRRLVAQPNNILDELGVRVYLRPEAALCIPNVGRVFIEMYTKGTFKSHAYARLIMASIVFFGGPRSCGDVGFVRGTNDCDSHDTQPVVYRDKEGLCIRDAHMSKVAS